MTISSSLPLASHRPEWAQRTVSTGPVCIDNVHSDFGGLPDSSLAWLSIGFVLHIRTLASRPPVAIREPSGWTCTENMDRRFGFESLFAESLWMTHAGLVKCIVVDGGCFRLWRARAVFGNHQYITSSLHWSTWELALRLKYLAQSHCNYRTTTKRGYVAWSQIRKIYHHSFLRHISSLIRHSDCAQLYHRHLYHFYLGQGNIRAFVWLGLRMSWLIDCQD